MKVVHFKLGDKTETIRLPSLNFSWEIGPKEEDNMSMTTIYASITNPVGCKGIYETAMKKSNAVILIDDNTRNTPAYKILPIVLDELNKAFIPKEKITILVALGTHRPMTQNELRLKCGINIVNNYSIVQHSYKDSDSLINLGYTSSGMPIIINKLYAKSDLKIAIGKIIPHVDAVWSGGAKIVLPGICGEETIEKFHIMSTGMRESLKDVDNAVRWEMEEVASKVGLDFLINVIVDEDENIKHIFCGDFIEAHRAGVEQARDIFTIRRKSVRKTDLIITNSYPATNDYWQAGKAVSAASPLVKPGGSIVIISPCRDGFCPDHPAVKELYPKNIDGIQRMIDNDEIEDKSGATVCIDMKRIQELHNVYYYGDGITEDELRSVCITKIHSLSEFTDEYIRQKPSCKIGIIHNGTEFMVTG